MRRQILHISVFSIMIAFTYPLDALSGNGVRQWQKKPDLIECNKTIAAKQNAYDRLTGWTTEAKVPDRDYGIPRLQEDFKHVFKKIEWRNREKDTQVVQKEKEAKKVTKTDKKKTKPLTSTEPLDDYRRLDSNSSNVSSRVGTDKEVSDNVPIKSRRSTPGPRKSFTPVDVLQQNLRENLYAELEKETANGQAVSAQILSTMQRRRRKRKEKKRNAPPSVESARAAQMMTADFEDEDTEGGSSPKAPAHAFWRKLSTAKPGATLKGGPQELVHKRNLKQAKQRAHDSKHELQMEKESDDARRKKILDKFRRLVRLLIHVRVLLNVARFRMEEEEKEKLTKGFKFEDGKEITFDATAFKTAMTSYGGLTSRARKALKKIPEERSKDDAKILLEIMLRLPTFAKYPQKVKQDLAKMLWYDRFKEGQVIVKQGDPGSRMYFVVSGPGVSLRRTDRFDKEGNPVSYQIQSIGAGSTFGELALIREMKRDYTAVCIGTSEFLSLSKCEFNTVLRNRWEKECNIRYTFLRNSQYFSTWTEQQLQACADSSELKDYPNNKIILGNISELTDSVYFIRRGRCEVVRRIMVVKHQSPYLRSTILLPNMAKQRTNFLDKPYGKRLRNMREEYVYLTITILEPGCYFGVGEDLRDTYIVAKGKTECIVVNSAQFSIQGKSELLRNLKSELEDTLPTNSAMYRQYQTNRKWFAYRKKLVEEVVGRRKSYVNKSDVPLSVRNEPTIHLM